MVDQENTITFSHIGHENVVISIETSTQSIEEFFSIKPNWKKDMLFRLSAGIYHQPPFYRELRDRTGAINPRVKAQKSIHFVLDNEYSFLLWNRSFALKGDVYYKNLENINPYTLEDVRIRYAASNNSKAYTYGAEVRMNGHLFPERSHGSA